MAKRKKKMRAKDKWVWMPHPGHLCVSQDCKFHLNTYVGGYIVSTVGEYFPDEPVREILAKAHGIDLKGRGDERRSDYMRKIGWEEIGLDRKYETMVFAAKKERAGSCCPYRTTSGCELDMQGYNDAEAAYLGHLKLCKKWSKK